MRSHQRSKKHHYIPKALQRIFSIEGNNEQIWYSERNNPSEPYSTPELRNISSTFMVKNLYTIHSENSPSDAIEREFYGPIDDFLGKIVPQFNELLSKGAAPTLANETFNQVREIFYKMIARTPHFTKDWQPEELGKLANEILLKDSSFELTVDERKVIESDLFNPLHLKKMGKDIIASSRTIPLYKVNKYLKNFRLRWVVSKGKHSFVLSSTFCYELGNGSGPNILASDGAEIWMPISPKHCMVLIKDPLQRIPEISHLEAHRIRKINEYAASRSRALSSQSRPLICSLIKNRNSGS